MAFNGELIYAGGVPLPLKYFAAESFSVTESIQDLDSLRTADGVLRRTALDHQIHKIEITTLELDNNEYGDLVGIIKNAFTISAERKLNIRFFNPFDNDYKTGDFYLQSDLKSNINRVDLVNNLVYYKPLDLHFTEY